MRRCSIGICLALAALAPAACSSGPQLSEAAQRGRSTYLSVCIACHNQDPAREGAVGPAIAGSSRELLEARVVHAGYPPGYTPKRDSKAMPPFPQLAGQVDDLHAFLSECCTAR
jgi:mono/diheme cytochrome c family protein